MTDLAHMKALKSAATPGTWVRIDTLQGESRIVVQGYERTKVIASIATDPADYGQANGELIAHAVAELPALVAAVERIQALHAESRCRPGFCSNCGQMLPWDSLRALETQ